MIYGDVAIDEAAGARLVHRQRAGKRSLSKGHELTTEDVAALKAEGVARVTVVRLEAGDIGEDAAADIVAKAAAGKGLDAGAAYTGRVNLHAAGPGLLLIDAARVDELNRIDPAITVATLPQYALVEGKQMVATVKIIPYAAPEAAVKACAEIAARGGPLIRVAKLRRENVGLIQTRLPDMKESVLDKTARVTAERIEALGSALKAEKRCGHDAAEIAAAIKALKAEGCGMLLIVGASAIADVRDVIPAGVTLAGGTVEHFGMPVDPGNLLLLAKHADGAPILGLPGCARSPKLNGFDWVLQRLLAGLTVTGRDIQGMGVGGLLMEIPSRPLPRAEATRKTAKDAAKPQQVAAVILAAGRSSRFIEKNGGGPSKLLASIGGEPLIALVVKAALASKARPVVVVVGHQQAEVRAALQGLDVVLAENPHYAEGLSTSLRAGLDALPAEIDGAIVALGDMPSVPAAALDQLIAAFNPLEGRSIVVPTAAGKRGNPVLWGRAYFAEMAKVQGDVGARHLIGSYPEAVAEVAMTDDGVLLDIDEPAALADFLKSGVSVV
ncbi:MAG TPA: molybdopterin-binding/glycosyltransferase family 2 protein [Alphaproteobacteria bacterium]|nr:molybdopterin-binding/glycosyltransferase family 2 protein [Alphaproteobacteria bacterium]